jgi:septum formation protein
VSESKQVAELILASASPRRREILGQLGVRFRVEPSGIDEHLLAGETSEQHVVRLAHDKAREVRARLQAEPARPFVLAADTIVVIDGQIFGKPSDDADALRMLRQLSGRTHRVLTALSLCQVGSDYADALLLATEVTFRSLDEQAARAYVASGEANDKAGSYAVQGLGAGLVRAICGSYTNVVGMPAAETLELLLKAGVLAGWPI